MRRLGQRISAALKQIPQVRSVEEQIGRAEGGEDTWGTHRGEMHVELTDTAGEDQEKVQAAIRDLLAGFPGVQTEVLTFLGDRIGETISGETAQVVVNIFGDDLDVLDAKAAEVAAVLSRVPGAADVQVSAPPGAPRVVIRLRPDRLTQFGYRPLEVLEAVRTAYQGDLVAQTYEGEKVFDVEVILDPAARQSPDAIGDLLVGSAGGARLKLNQLADVFLTTGRYAILHDGARRRQTLTCNPSGRDVASFVAEAQSQIASKVAFPAGVYAEFSGAAEEQRRAKNELLLHSLAAAVGIIVLLAVVFHRARPLLLVLANLPFALVGGIVTIVLFTNENWPGSLATLHQAGAALGHLVLNPGAAWRQPGASLAAFWKVLAPLQLGTFSLGTLIGFITLFGITMRNSIMMISHFEHLVQVEGQPWNLATAVRGATERLIPVLMTALVTALGLLPLALGSGEAGREIEGPMAIVILGGLVTSTALNLLVLPALALRYGKLGDGLAAPAQTQ